MPKKAPRNAFYFFMLDFKEEQRTLGIHFENLAEVSKAADPHWKNAHPSVREKYKEKERVHKEKNKISVVKYNSLGVPLHEIERKKKEELEAIEFERNDVNNMIKIKAFNDNILEEDFYIIDVNSYCCVGKSYLIAEFTILKFSLLEGVKDNYHEILNPGSTPIGYGYQVKMSCEEFGLDPPDESLPKSNYMQILANIIDYLKQNNQNTRTLPPLFTILGKVPEVQSFISDLCSRAGEDDSIFRIYSLDYMFFTLINSIKTKENEGFPKESLATTRLINDPFGLESGLGCEHHEAGEKTTKCSLSRAKRWAFVIMDNCCPLVSVEVVPGKHVPPKYDVNKIIAYKNEKKISNASASMASMSCNSSTVTDNLNDSSIVYGHTNSYVSYSRKSEREHIPLRMPRGESSFAAAPAPELTENEFPSLTSFSRRGRGRGRGRGLPGSFSDLKIND